MTSSAEGLAGLSKTPRDLHDARPPHLNSSAGHSASGPRSCQSGQRRRRLADAPVGGRAGRWHPRWDLEALLLASQDLLSSGSHLTAALTGWQPKVLRAGCATTPSKESFRESLENVGTLSKTLFLFTPSSFWVVRGLLARGHVYSFGSSHNVSPPPPPCPQNKSP